MSWGQPTRLTSGQQQESETTGRPTGTYRDYLLARNSNSVLTGYLAGGGEPSSPSLSLGERVVWLQDGGAVELGSVRWIGRLSALDRANWSVGVEFDRPIGTGNGRFAGKQYFIARNGHALFLPILTLMKAEEFFGAHRNATRALETQRFESAGDHCPMDISRNPCLTKQRSLNLEQQRACVGGTAFCPCPLHHHLTPSTENCYATSATARHKSVTICEKSRLGGQDWSDDDFPFQSWKSSQSVVSCPAALGPGAILMEVATDSSESDAGAGKFKTLMSCLLPGSSRRKKKKKKKKLKKFVLAQQQQKQYNFMTSDGTPLRTSESCAAFQSSCCHLHAYPQPKRNVSCSGLDVFNVPNFKADKVPKAPAEKVGKVGFVDAPLKKSKAPPPPRPVSPLASPATKQPLVKPSAPTIHAFNSLPGKPVVSPSTAKQSQFQSTLPARTKEDPNYTGNLVLIGNQRSQTRLHQSMSSLQVPKNTFVPERAAISPHPRRRQAKKRAPMPPAPAGLDYIRGGLAFSSPDSTRSSSRSGDNANFLDSTDDDRVDSPNRPALPKKTVSHDSLSRFGYSQESLKKKDLEELRNTKGKEAEEVETNPGRSYSSVAASNLQVSPAPTEIIVINQELTRRSSPLKEQTIKEPLTLRMESRSPSPKITQKESKECQTLDFSPKKESLPSTSKETPDSKKKPESATKSKKKFKKEKAETFAKEQNKVKEILTEIEQVVKSKPTVKDFVMAFTKFTEKAEKIAADYHTETANLNSKPEPPKKVPVKTVVKVEDPPSLKSVPTKWTFNQSERRLNISFTEANALMKDSQEEKRIEDKITNRKKSLKKRPAPPVPDVTLTSSGELNDLDAVPGVSGAPFSQTRVALRQLSAFQRQHRMALSVGDLTSENDPQDRWQHLPRPRTPGSSPKAANGPACTGKPPLPLRALELSCGGSPALFQQLEEAIARGQHKRAAALAREMALHKVLQQGRPRTLLRSASSATPPSLGCLGRKPADEQFVTVSLYVEDKDTHQGPIPLTVYPSMTVSLLKDKVARELGFARRCQRWILGRTFVVDDQMSLASLDVCSPGCPVFLYIVQPRREEEDEDWREEVGGRGKGGANNPTPPVSPSRTDVLETLLEEAADYGVTKTAPNGTAEADCSSSENSVRVTTATELDSASASLETADLSDVDDEDDDDVDIADIIQAQPLTEGSQESSSPEDSVPEERPVSRALARLSYDQLVALEDVDLIPNAEEFECPVCFGVVESQQGAVLRDCLHMFCRDCLARSVEYCEEAVIKCLFRNDDYSCDSHLLEREIKALVSPALFEKHLQRSMKAAESRAENSFHCKSADCPGWCLFEDNVNVFACPVCAKVNCLTCAAIHPGKDCRQYQDELQEEAEQSEDARMTKEYLDSMVSEGKAMRCPTCRVIVMKKWGCDWLKCSVCHTEICWVTKGPRWGPAGRGDTSGGCKCMIDKVRCHPQCNYCH